jgi:hypothetical protein
VIDLRIGTPGVLRFSRRLCDQGGPDTEAIPREMEVTIRLSHGCAELRGTAVRVGETDRTWSEERRRVEGGRA